MELLIANPGHKGKKRKAKRKKIAKKTRVLKKVRKNPRPLRALRTNHTKDWQEDLKLLGGTVAIYCLSDVQLGFLNNLSGKIYANKTVKVAATSLGAAAITGGLYWWLSKSPKTSAWASAVLLGGGIALYRYFHRNLQQPFQGSPVPVSGLGMVDVPGEGGVVSSSLNGGVFEGSSI